MLKSVAVSKTLIPAPVERWTVSFPVAQLKTIFSRCKMEDNKNKVDDMTLALLWLTMFDVGYAIRAWKRFNRKRLNRLQGKGYTDDPKSNAKSVIVTEEGVKRAEELFNQYFGIEKMIRIRHGHLLPLMNF